MSWSKVLAGAAALTLAGGLSGCFQPLYSEAAHPGLVDDLHAIDVAPIDKRIGHYLAEDLIADLNGTGQTASPPKYRLTVTVSGPQRHGADGFAAEISFDGNRLDRHPDPDGQLRN